VIVESVKTKIAQPCIVQGRRTQGGIRADLQELLGSIQQIKTLGIDNVLHGEILARLSSGKATVSDLAAALFGKQSTCDVSHTEYMRVARALTTLQRKGYVSRALFGKERPYRLTALGKEVIAAAARNEKQVYLITKKDLVLYATSVVLVVTGTLLTRVFPVPAALAICWLASGVVCGISLSRFVSTLRRIW